MSGIVFSNITKRFGQTVAVESLNLEIAEGEFVALVGPSGCGKTTSLRMLAGLEDVSEGQIFVDGRDVTNLGPSERDLAMVFQNYALYPHMTVAGNIGFSLQLSGLGRDALNDRVKNAADLLGIGHLLDRRPKQLSGGQRQRVAVARCIVRQPAAFLFDEPLSNLDAKLRGTARVEIAKLQKNLGITTLYVTHDQVEAMTMADRVVLMEGGRIRQAGTPMDLYHHPKDLFVATFLGMPPMNLLKAEVANVSGAPVLRWGAMNLELPGVATGAVTLGLRPERLVAGHVDGVALAFSGHVSHVERLGAETLVEFRLESGSASALTARLPGTRTIQIGEHISVSAPLDALHVFDETGAAVATSPARRAAAFY
ncbi:iron(III) transport system ATP-binding protein [Ketogulonicigenium robustum]|uniref:Iron(III) transport system ATP-binding protein n=1 Tax=Ketogulonicigenium robustum TaxID=92947 RepID=A0A1W6P0N3_9RHOB|nr:ABC transporter ATP-binding protein [Ketogulonicigenium robustum]ARO14890.1 iron(III) transport system ATP-binding protein [Ketogulonicigenium robustum]